jgi:hypothetical protein
MTNTDLKNVRKIVGCIDWLWRKLSKNTPPKLHALLHLLDDLIRLRSLKGHNEGKIEMTVIDCSLKYQANAKVCATVATQQAVKEAQKRNFGEQTKAGRDLEVSELKRKKFDHQDAILNCRRLKTKFR